MIFCLLLLLSLPLAAVSAPTTPVHHAPSSSTHLADEVKTPAAVLGLVSDPFGAIDVIAVRQRDGHSWRSTQLHVYFDTGKAGKDQLVHVTIAGQSHGDPIEMRLDTNGRAHFPSHGSAPETSHHLSDAVLDRLYSSTLRELKSGHYVELTFSLAKGKDLGLLNRPPLTSRVYFYHAADLTTGAFVVSDVDGTITKSDLQRKTKQDGVVGLFKGIASEGSKLFPIYLSNRPACLTKTTRDFLHEIGLPDAPVITNPVSLRRSAQTELKPAPESNPMEFKVRAIEEIGQACGSQGEEFCLGAGFGNKKTDLDAYDKAGIMLAYITDAHGRLTEYHGGAQTSSGTSYTELGTAQSGDHTHMHTHIVNVHRQAKAMEEEKLPSKPKPKEITKPRAKACTTM